jgi:hypothetical protein
MLAQGDFTFAAGHRLNAISLRRIYEQTFMSWVAPQC